MACQTLLRTSSLLSISSGCRTRKWASSRFSSWFSSSPSCCSNATSTRTMRQPKRWWTCALHSTTRVSATGARTGLSKHFGSSIVSRQLPDDVNLMTFICCSLMIDALDKHHGDIISLRGVCHYHGLLPSHLSDCFAHWYDVCIVYWILLNLSTNYEQSHQCVFADLRILIHVDLHVSVSALPIGRTLLVFQLITQLDHRISITCTATWKTSPSGRA